VAKKVNQENVVGLIKKSKMVKNENQADQELTEIQKIKDIQVLKLKNMFI
jgi:hypothetical protein